MFSTKSWYDFLNLKFGKEGGLLPGRDDTMRLQGGIFEVPYTLMDSQLQPLPGLDPFLALMRMEGVEFYAVTQDSRPAAQGLLQQLGLSQSFRGVLAAREQGCDITSPSLYEKAARRMGTAPQVTAVFTARPGLIPGLKEAGFQTVLVGSSFSREDCAQADLVISDYGAMTHSDLK